MYHHKQGFTVSFFFRIVPVKDADVVTFAQTTKENNADQHTKDIILSTTEQTKQLNVT